ncbi:MAG: DUF721 domain-containing protein [Actinobacteria bacterium]|nr:DUF721 domain-containing protein [Actinomycetota bacterium]
MSDSGRRRRRHRGVPRAAGDLLRRYTDSPAAAATAASDPAACWPEVAGPLAADTMVLRVARSGMVTVACRSASVAQEVSFRAHRLRDALATACGRPISGIRAVIADHAMPEPPPGRPAPPGPPRPEAVDAAEGLAATINDPDLRAVVARAAAMAFERRWTP